MENLELLIKQDLDDGIGMLSIAKKYGVGTSMVQKVKKQGKYYLNPDTGEEEFSAKKIPIERQIYHYLLYRNEIKNYEKLEKYLNVTRSTIFRWKDKPKLIDINMIMNKVNEFLGLQQTITPKERKKRKTKKKRNRIGLYFLYQNHKLMYIGKSKDINKRLYQHSYNSHIEGLEGTYDVKIILIGNEKDTELAISMLKPPLNKEFVDELECGGFFSELMNRIPKDYNRRIEIKEKR